MNRHRHISDMEAAWELRPDTDETPGSRAHGNRFQRQIKKQPPDEAEKTSNSSKTEETGSFR